MNDRREALTATEVRALARARLAVCPRTPTPGERQYARLVLCTVIHDSYTGDERCQIRDALERLLSPGQPDWSPKGVYCYWDRTSHEILYLGLASELPDRFAQHNGLVSHAGGNKKREINDYFSRNQRLGFTIIIQSKAIGLMEQIQKLDPTMGATAARTIAVGEGQLIEMHRLVHGKWPAWNRTGGAASGKRYAKHAPALLELLAARRDSLFAARSTLRTVADDLHVRLLEATIHASRMRAMMEAHGIAKIPRPGERIEASRIERSFMLRDGHLVEELDPSDAAIRRWLELLGKPEHWRQEAAGWQKALEAMPGRPLQANEKAVQAILDSVVSEAAPRSHILATAELLEGTYLDERVVIL